jgi:oligopeptidase B
MDTSLPERVLLDENAEAKKHPFYMVAGLDPSPDDARLAWAEDTRGGELYTLRVVDVATRKALSPPIPVRQVAGNSDECSYVTRRCFLYIMPWLRVCLVCISCMPAQNTSGDFVWANDNSTLFYVTKDELDRPFKVGCAG